MTNDVTTVVSISSSLVVIVPRIGASSGNMLWFDDLVCDISSSSHFDVMISYGFIGCDMGAICPEGTFCVDHSEDGCDVFTCEGEAPPTPTGTPVSTTPGDVPCEKEFPYGTWDVMENESGEWVW